MLTTLYTCTPQLDVRPTYLSQSQKRIGLCDYSQSKLIYFLISYAIIGRSFLNGLLVDFHRQYMIINSNLKKPNDIHLKQSHL